MEENKGVFGWPYEENMHSLIKSNLSNYDPVGLEDCCWEKESWREDKREKGEKSVSFLGNLQIH